MTSTTVTSKPLDIRYAATTYTEPNSDGEYGIDVVTYQLDEDGELVGETPGSMSWFAAPRNITTWIDIDADEDDPSSVTRLDHADALLASIGFRRVDNVAWDYVGPIADAGPGYEVSIEPV